ncbi:MAG: transposase [Gemmatimonadetes bacterium]|nr:transposase [Gemmatimonadota bacterium]MYG35107.1 transposase [Gemmatimonadota bacterium]
MKDVNLVSLIDRYNTEDKCRDALEAIRWPGGVACIRCGDTQVDGLSGRAQWQCRSCDYQFSVTAGLYSTERSRRTATSHIVRKLPDSIGLS